MTTQPATTPDPQQAQQFGGRLFTILVDGLLTLLLDIGHRTGLFEAVARPATSQGLADRAGLTERYVREWLGAMTTGGIVTYDASTQCYTLPPAHAVCLTGETAANLAPSAQALAVLARQVPKLAASFRGGGGVPYADYQPDFAEILDGGLRRLYDQYLLTHFLPAVRPSREWVHPAGAGAGRRPSCSSIRSRSNIRWNETCLPSRKRSTWM